MDDPGLIFISYAGPDVKHAEALAHALNERDHATFVDTLDLLPGDTWDTGITDALKRAAMIAVLVSAEWTTGDRWYAHDEVARAVELARRGARLVPVVIDGVAAVDMPSGLARLVALRDADRDWGASADRLSAIFRGAATGHQPGDRLDRELRISLSRLPVGGRFFEGRDDELAALDGAWDDPDTQVQTVIGVGGEGKTALVERWLHGMKRADYGGAARVYGWSFYSQGAGEDRQASADLFIEQLLTWLGDPRPYEGDPWTKGARLARLVREQPTLLVLDGLEPLQFPPGESAGRIKDPALATLLRELAARMNGLCLVTSRQPLRDFAKGTPGIAQLELPPLSAEVGARVLREWDVQGDEAELRRAVEDVQGHALAVNLMGSYLAMFEDGDVRRRDRIDGLLEAEDGGGHAKRVMAAYDRWLAPDDRRVLRIMGLFDRAADAPALAAVLAAPVIPGLTEGLADGVEGRRWLKAVKHLRDVGLLLREGGLDAHPLVREAFGAMLRQEAPAAWQAAHGRLFAHFAGSAQPLPDDLVGLEPLYRAVMHGCAAGRHEVAELLFLLRIRRGPVGHSIFQLGAFAADLAALAHFFAQPWSRPHPGLSTHTRSWLLAEVGFALRALGRLVEAVDPTEAGLAMWIEKPNWKEAANVAGNLSELLLTLGRLERSAGADGALARARQAVDHADRSGDAFQRRARRVTLADALHQRGRRAAARALFAATERLQVEQQPELPRLYSLQGYQYGDLLLADRPAEARERAEWMVDYPWTSLVVIDLALHRLLLGRAALALGDHPTARLHLDAAVAGLRRAGTAEFIARGLLARAAYHHAVADLTAAAADLAEARGIAERGGMRLHLTNVELEAARLALTRGDRAEAARAYAAARDAVRAIGYHRRDRELEALAHALGEPPPDWLHQADIAVDLPIDGI